MKQHAHLVRMTNQIAQNFATMGDVNAAVATADHIRAFWDPRMRAAILEDQNGLSPTAKAAIEMLESPRCPAHIRHATEFDPGKA